MSRKNMFNLGFLLILVIVGASMISKNYLSPKGSELTEQQIIKDTIKISKRYGNNSSCSEIWVKDNGEKYVSMSLYRTNKTNKEPIEIYAIFDIFLYLQDRIPPYNIVGVDSSIEASPSIEGSLNGGATISTKEFLNIFKTIAVENKKHKDIVKELSEKWITDNFYNRSSLKYNSDNEYKKLLLTRWERSLCSYGEDYFISYSLDGNFLYIDDYLYMQKEGIGASKNIAAIPVNETGYLYGAWDEQNNIWVYGETTGIQVIGLDKNGDWTIKENVVIDKMPYPLKKVKEHYSSNN